jgi:hypothetical protein
MEHAKIIFFRNFFMRAFIIGVAFALFYFVATCVFWNTGLAWATHFFKIDEKEFGRLVLVFFVELRVVLVFLFLVPALALHWMARKK